MKLMLHPHMAEGKVAELTTSISFINMLIPSKRVELLCLNHFLKAPAVNIVVLGISFNMNIGGDTNLQVIISRNLTYLFCFPNKHGNIDTCIN
jgi:hypothetical protein